MALVVENDQTDCGQLAPMQRFGPPAGKWRSPVTLTFDMGNWLWVGDSPEEAATRLAPGGQLYPRESRRTAHSTVPRRRGSRRCALAGLLSQLPADAPTRIEFPLEGQT